MTRSPETGRSLIYAAGLETQNLPLAAALAAAGVPLDRNCPCREILREGAKPVVFFFFEPTTADGRWTTRELIEAWNDPEWHRRNPEHPFAYIKCAMGNRERLLDLVKERTPLACVQRGRKQAFLSVNASTSLQDAIFAHL